MYKIQLFPVAFFMINSLLQVEAIIGGQTVPSPHSFPCVVHLNTYTTFGSGLFSPGNLLSCTGSIITKNVILTAAHCAEHLEEANPLLSYSEVTIGHSNYSSEFAIKIGVKSILKHPNYIYVEESFTDFEEYVKYDKEKKFTHDNDIALWKLSKDLEFNDEVQPIALPKAIHSDTFLTETELLFAGWGKAENNINETIIKESESLFEIWNKDSTNVSNFLNYIQYRYDNAIIQPENMKMTAMQYHKMESCINTKQKLNDERISMLVCATAGILNGICHGDSGGPLMRRDQGRRHNYEVVGVASNIFYGIKCTGQSVFARVSMYVPWIEKNVDTFVDLHYNYYFDYETVTTIISSVELIYWMNGNLLLLLAVLLFVVEVLTLFIFRIFITVGVVMFIHRGLNSNCSSLWFILNYDYGSMIFPTKVSCEVLLMAKFYTWFLNTIGHLLILFVIFVTIIYFCFHVLKKTKRMMK